MTHQVHTMTKPSSTVQHQTIATPLGDVGLAASHAGLVGVWFVGQAHAPQTQDWQEVSRSEAKRHPVLDLAHAQLTQYLAGERQRFELPLALPFGTPFQQRVWHALQTIAYGQTTHYGDIAQRVGSPNAVRAVGAAIGRNPLSMVIACHRVLGANGALTGYAGGIARKKSLLALEAAHA